MRAPNDLLQEAENLRLDYMAVKTIEVLNNYQTSHIVEPHDEKVLEDAQSFLTDIAYGAEFVQTNKVNNLCPNPTRSLKYLSYALDPRQKLSELVKEDDDIAKFFLSLAESIPVGNSKVDEQNINKSIRFFRTLSNSLVAIIRSVDRRSSGSSSQFAY